MLYLEALWERGARSGERGRSAGALAVNCFPGGAPGSICTDRPWRPRGGQLRQRRAGAGGLLGRAARWIRV